MKPPRLVQSNRIIAQAGAARLIKAVTIVASTIPRLTFIFSLISGMDDGRRKISLRHGVAGRPNSHNGAAQPTVLREAAGSRIEPLA
jgi:hypothetical protein